jgi:hypothetical protein
MHPLVFSRVFNRISVKGPTSALYAIRNWTSTQSEFHNFGVYWNGVFDAELVMFFETNGDPPVKKFEDLSNNYWDCDFLLAFENLHIDMRGTAFITKGRSLVSEHHE